MTDPIHAKAESLSDLIGALPALVDKDLTDNVVIGLLVDHPLVPTDNPTLGAFMGLDTSTGVSLLGCIEASREAAMWVVRENPKYGYMLVAFKSTAANGFKVLAAAAALTTFVGPGIRQVLTVVVNADGQWSAADGTTGWTNASNPLVDIILSVDEKGGE